MKNDLFKYAIALTFLVSIGYNNALSVAPEVSLSKDISHKELSAQDKKIIKSIVTDFNKDVTSRLLETLSDGAQLYMHIQQTIMKHQDSELSQQLDSLIDTLEPLMAIINHAYQALKSLQNSTNQLSVQAKKYLSVQIKKCVPHLETIAAQRSPKKQEDEVLKAVTQFKSNIDKLAQTL